MCTAARWRWGIRLEPAERGPWSRSSMRWSSAALRLVWIPFASVVGKQSPWLLNFADPPRVRRMVFAGSSDPWNGSANKAALGLLPSPQNPRARSRAGGKNRRLGSGLSFVKLANLASDEWDRFSLDQAYGAASETGTGHTATDHASVLANGLCDLDHCVEFRTT